MWQEIGNKKIEGSRLDSFIDWKIRRLISSSVGNSGSGSNFGDGDNGVAQFGGSPSDLTGGFGGQVGGFDRQSDTNTAISGGIGGSEPVINLKSILRGGDQEVFTQIKDEDGNNGNPPIPQQNSNIWWKPLNLIVITLVKT